MYVAVFWLVSIGKVTSVGLGAAWNFDLSFFVSAIRTQRKQEQLHMFTLIVIVLTVGVSSLSPLCSVTLLSSFVTSLVCIFSCPSCVVFFG